VMLMDSSCLVLRSILTFSPPAQFFSRLLPHVFLPIDYGRTGPVVISLVPLESPFSKSPGLFYLYAQWATWTLLGGSRPRVTFFLRWPFVILPLAPFCTQCPLPPHVDWGSPFPILTNLGLPFSGWAIPFFFLG